MSDPGSTESRSGPVEEVVLTLYVSGTTARSRRAVENLRSIAEAWSCRTSVIDVMVDPAAAEAGGILATPTLVREAPPPAQRVIGDLTDRSRVVAELGLGDLPDELKKDMT